MKVIFEGFLRKRVAIGGETSGWALTLDQPQAIFGNQLKEIDVDPNGHFLRQFSGKHVTVSGTLVIEQGIERGDYPVLKIETIQQTNSN